MVRRAQAEDQEAYEELIRRHQHRVFAVAGGILRRREDVEDIAQQVFVKAYFSLKRFDQRAAFSTWLYKITVNECWDLLRKKKVRPLVYEADLSEEQARQIEASEAKGNMAPDISERLEARERVEQLLEGLDERDRLMLVLKEVEGFFDRRGCRGFGFECQHREGQAFPRAPAHCNLGSQARELAGERGSFFERLDRKIIVISEEAGMWDLLKRRNDECNHLQDLLEDAATRNPRVANIEKLLEALPAGPRSHFAACPDCRDAAQGIIGGTRTHGSDSPERAGAWTVVRYARDGGDCGTREGTFGIGENLDCGAEICIPARSGLPPHFCW